ncbi:MAG: hypothetical protein IAE79_02375 [Anaerolinea sp.]|nr:hypothetical protein [Anaerolinea sp.]
MSETTDQELISIGEVTIPFYEDRLIVQLGEDGEIYVALRPIVDALGLDWSGQLQRIKRDPVLSEGITTISVVITPAQMPRERGEGDKMQVATRTTCPTKLRPRGRCTLTACIRDLEFSNPYIWDKMPHISRMLIFYPDMGHPTMGKQFARDVLSFLQEG